MKLYEIDERLAELLSLLEPDPDTGEVICDDELLAEMEALGIERKRIMTYLAQEVLNTRSDAVALKAEEDRLAKRRKSLENREKRLMAILERECGGERTDFGVAVGRYKPSVSTEITDSKAAVEYLTAAHPECLKYPDPEIRKDPVKRLIQSGENIPGVRLAENITFSLR